MAGPTGLASCKSIVMPDRNVLRVSPVSLVALFSLSNQIDQSDDHDIN